LKYRQKWLQSKNLSNYRILNLSLLINPQIQFDSVALMFRALAEPARLRLLILLSDKQLNVSEIAEIEGEKIGTISARLKVLLNARLVRRSRDGQNALYTIADKHIIDLVSNAIEHSLE
jgi:ArsR family transcriptional regulator